MNSINSDQRTNSDYGPQSENQSMRREAVEKTFDSLIQAFVQLNAPFRATLSENGLSRSHILLLRTVMTSRETTAGELAEALLVTNGAVTQLLKKLEAEGWITRTRGEHDHRIVYVRATEKTKRRFEKLHISTVDDLAEVFNGWAMNDIEKLGRLLTRIGDKST